MTRSKKQPWVTREALAAKTQEQRDTWLALSAKLVQLRRLEPLASYVDLSRSADRWCWPLSLAELECAIDNGEHGLAVLKEELRRRLARAAA